MEAYTGGSKFQPDHVWNHLSSLCLLLALPMFSRSSLCLAFAWFYRENGSPTGVRSLMTSYPNDKWGCGVWADVAVGKN